MVYSTQARHDSAAQLVCLDTLRGTYELHSLCRRVRQGELPEGQEKVPWGTTRHTVSNDLQTANRKGGQWPPTQHRTITFASLYFSILRKKEPETKVSGSFRLCAYFIMISAMNTRSVSPVLSNA